MPVLTAVARILDNELTPKKAVMELMSLPQVITLLETKTYILASLTLLSTKRKPINHIFV